MPKLIPLSKRHRSARQSDLSTLLGSPTPRLMMPSSHYYNNCCAPTVPATPTTPTMRIVSDEDMNSPRTSDIIKEDKESTSQEIVGSGTVSQKLASLSSSPLRHSTKSQEQQMIITPSKSMTTASPPVGDHPSRWLEISPSDIQDEDTGTTLFQQQKHNLLYPKEQTSLISKHHQTNGVHGATTTPSRLKRFSPSQCLSELRFSTTRESQGEQYELSMSDAFCVTPLRSNPSFITSIDSCSCPSVLQRHVVVESCCDSGVSTSPWGHFVDMVAEEDEEDDDGCNVGKHHEYAFLSAASFPPSPTTYRSLKRSYDSNSASDSPFNFVAASESNNCNYRERRPKPITIDPYPSVKRHRDEHEDHHLSLPPRRIPLTFSRQFREFKEREQSDNLLTTSHSYEAFVLVGNLDIVDETTNQLGSLSF